MHQDLANRKASGSGWLSRAVLGLFGGIAAPLEPRLVPIESRPSDDLREAPHRRDGQRYRGSYDR